MSNPPPGEKITSKYVVECLKKQYTNYGRFEEWFCCEELRVGTGFKGKHVSRDAEQRFDFFAMGLTPSKHFEKIVFEIKVSRSDFLKELKQPLKRRMALLYSNSFYFAAPKGLILPNELPLEAGLVEIDPSSKSNSKCHTKVTAPWRDWSRPSWSFIASIARRIARIEKEGNQILEPEKENA